MQNLFYFFARFGNFILFLLLEIFCIYLIVNYNKSQRDIFINSTNIFASHIYEKREEFTRFYRLNALADSIALENARLRERISQYELRDAEHGISVEWDTVYTQHFFVPAKIVKNSITLSDNILLVNKGSRDSVEQGMGVITDKGVVGIVRNVKDNYSNVLSINHTKSRISIAVKGKDYFGNMSWGGNNPNIHNVNDLPVHAEVEKGDTIVTSGFSSIFPPDVPIGIISSIERLGGSNFYTTEVELFEDMSNVKYVYIVGNRDKNEITELEGLEQ